MGDVNINITGITQRRIDLVFGIDYSDDIDKAQKIMQDIVDNHEYILKKPEAIVRLHKLADSSVNFFCRPWVKPEDYWDVYWYVTREVKRLVQHVEQQVTYSMISSYLNLSNFPAITKQYKNLDLGRQFILLLNPIGVESDESASTKRHS